MASEDDKTRIDSAPDAQSDATARLFTPQLTGELTQLVDTVREVAAQGADATVLAQALSTWSGAGETTLSKDDALTVLAELDAAHSAGNLNERQFGDLQRTVLEVAPAVTAADRTVPLLAQGNGPSSAFAGPATVGSTVKGRFMLMDVIGEGGMGVVYRAKDLLQEELEDRQPFVALKVLGAEFARDSRMRMALQREARKAHSLAHPNVITMYNFDREGDTVYLTMELLEGQTLKELIADHPNGLPREQAFNILRGMCLGLAYAHNKGIVHSDFKSGNVFYTDKRETKILDFGIARAVPRVDASGESEKTTFDVGSLGGLTPAYASPEMLAGQDPQPPDDVFALGIVAYQLFTGRHPFDYVPADQAQAKGKWPDAPKKLKLREWRALSSALAFDGAQRPVDAAAFLRKLEGISSIRKLAFAALVGLAITTAYVVYDGTTEVLDARPDVAFENLTPVQQEQFSKHLSEGRMLHKFNDVGNALSSYVDAYKVHPRNPEVVAVLDDLIKDIVTYAESTTDQRDRDIVVDNLVKLSEVDDFLAERPALQDALSTLR